MPIGFRGVRWERDSGRWFAFVLVACALACFNRPRSGMTVPRALRAAGRAGRRVRGPQPQRRLGRLHGLLNHRQQLGGQAVQVDCWRSRALNAWIVRAAS